MVRPPLFLALINLINGEMNEVYVIYLMALCWLFCFGSNLVLWLTLLRTVTLLSESGPWQR